MLQEKILTCIKWYLVLETNIWSFWEWSILQYLWPALKDNWSWKPIFGRFKSGRFTQVLLYSYILYMSLVARKPGFAACKQQRRRPACASAQPDQHLCYLLNVKYDIQICFIEKFHILASLYSWAGWFVNDLVGNPKDRFSRDEAHMQYSTSSKSFIS